MNKTKVAPGKKIRITLDLSPQFYKRLESLEGIVDADSKAGLIRQALQLYEYVAKRSIEGWVFRAINTDNGQEEAIAFYSLSGSNASVGDHKKG
jgi:hypothetical protein